MRQIFQKGMGYIISLFVVAIYFVMSYLTITDWELKSAQTIVEGLLLFISSVIVYTSLTKQGIINGRSNKKYIETLEAHLIVKKKIMPNIRYLQPWLNKDYVNLLKIGRTVYVDSAGYDYKDVFDETGKIKVDFKVEKPKFAENLQKPRLKALKKLFWLMFSDEMKFYRMQKKFIKKAQKYKVTRHTVSTLMSIDADTDPNNFGISEREYMKRQTSSNVISRLIFSFLSPSISVVFNGFNLETLFVQLLSVMLVLTSALSSMFASYFFMIRNHREKIIKTINKLEEFDNADLSEFKEKENERICSEKSICTQSPVVEEIRTEPLTRENSDVCSNT